MKKPLVNKKYVLERSYGKGGWTYAIIPEILPDKKTPFGWVRVNGSIDGIEISKYHLMPSGKGALFLPVKSAIRKKIKKQAGDYIHVILFADEDSLDIPEELLQCLQDEPEALQFFNALTESEQYHYVKWIYAAKTDQKKVERISNTLIRLSKKLKYYDKARD